MKTCAEGGTWHVIGFRDDTWLCLDCGVNLNSKLMNRELPVEAP